jgi:tripartite-type tricarboxylate transporter receptor subunit TctC
MSEPVRHVGIRHQEEKMKSSLGWRSVGVLAALTAAMSMVPCNVRAQDYPSQDIRLICGFPPGSGADIFVRFFAEKLRPIAGRTVVVENKVGAASNIVKQKGSRASYAVAANPGRIMGAIYKDAAGLDALEVQYRTAPDSLNEMATGKLDYGLHDPVFALAQQRAGRLRVLAVSTGKRLQSQPDLPTMAESGVPMDLTLWWGVMVPAATPKPIIDTINRWFSQIVSTEETKKFLNDAGADPMITMPEQAQEMFEKAIKEWGEYVRMAKIEPQ